MANLTYDSKAVILAMKTIEHNVSYFLIQAQNFERQLSSWKTQEESQAARKVDLDEREQAIVKEEGRLLVLRDELMTAKADFLRRAKG